MSGRVWCTTHVTIVERAIPVKVEDAPDGKVSITWGEAWMEDQGPGQRPKPVLQEDKLHTEIYDSIISAIGDGHQAARGIYKFLLGVNKVKRRI